MLLRSVSAIGLREFRMAVPFSEGVKKITEITVSVVLFDL